MDRTPGPIHMLPRWPASRFSEILLVLALFVLLFAGPLRTAPAGHVGVKDFFGQMSAQTLPVLFQRSAEPADHAARP